MTADPAICAVSAPARPAATVPTATGDLLTFKGKNFKANARLVEQLVSAAEEAEAEGLTSYQSWYCIVQGVRVSPKWLVSQLTGLSVGSFHSDEARRFLNKLGLEVYRV